MVIRHASFDHGWYYHYRVHQPKAAQLLQPYPELHRYLLRMFSECPHEYFLTGPRSSGLRFPLESLRLRQVTGHEVSSLAREGLEANEERFKSNHSKVQVFMLEHDSSTVAMEVPLWLEPSELPSLLPLRSALPLTGHIDLLRVEGDKVWIWDFKPGAAQEVYARTRTYCYALMLSQRTGIPLETIRCGYFDQSTAFVFRPERNLIREAQAMLD